MMDYWVLELGRQENATSSEVELQSSRLNYIDLRVPVVKYRTCV